MSAKQVADPNTAWTFNGASAWNGGRMHVSYDYGFGEVDAKAAVRLAETWTSERTLTNELSTSSASGAVNLAIPDATATGVSTTLSMNAGIVVEHAEITVNLTHQRAGDVIVKLISPSGTESILVNRSGKTPGSTDAADRGDLNFAGSSTLNFTFASTRDWGEQSGGDWRLQVIDAATGDIGTLNNWTLNLYGRAQDSDNTFVYTNEYSILVASDPARGTLSDANGGRDTINVAAVDGNNTVNLSTGAATIRGAALTIQNPGNFENVFSGDGNDTLVGNAENNLLAGGRGTNTLTGGAGLDTFVLRKRDGGVDTVTDFSTASDKVILAGFVGKQFSDLAIAQQGTSTVVGLGNGQSLVLQQTAAAALTAAHFQFQDEFSAPAPYVDSSASWDTPAGGTITGTNNAETIVGTAASETILGLDGNDVIQGGAGDDTIDGGLGQDTRFGDAGNDRIFLEGDPAGFTLSANGLVFTSGHTAGGTGSDRFVVQALGGGSFGNVITDFELSNPNEKIDLSQIGVFSFAELTFSNNNINGTTLVTVRARNDTAVALLGISSGQLSASNFIFADPPAGTGGTGGPQNSGPGVTVSGNTLTGNAGGNVLDGGVNAQVMVGRTGDDTYVVDNAADVVQELPGGGFDTVRSSITYALSTDVENLVLTGSANIDATGNDEANRITGNSGNNHLDGRGGSDVLVGGAGDDSYQVDIGTDTVIEQDDEGVDTVFSSVSYLLGRNIENLVLTGGASVNATGNELSNALTGNAASNTLDGAQGADNMTGGAGDDVYLVDNAGDTVVEALDEGTDTVFSSINYTLSSNVEHLILAGSSGLSGTGNALDNVIIGNSAANNLAGGAGNDLLDGRGGADTLSGGAGDDTYVVESSGDTVVENAGEGIDTVQSSITFDLSTRPNVENVTLTGTANINATGNAGVNMLIGNVGANVLTADAGDDYLEGGAGADTMAGGSGNDVYWFDSGSGADVIQDASGSQDTVRFGAGILPGSVSVSRSGLDLVLTRGADTATVRDWFAGTASKVERVEFENGTVWDVATLRSMSNLAPVSSQPLADQKVTEGEPFNFVVPATAFADGDASIGETLTYSATLATGDPLPSWLAFDAQTRAFTGTPPDIGPWLLGIRVSVTDSVGATASNDFFLDIANLVLGTSGDDVLQGTGGRDVIRLLAGNDLVWGMLGDDQILGGDGNDQLIGDDGWGGIGDDVLDGGAGDDHLWGEGGNDLLMGGDGADELQGQEGTTRSKAEAETIFCSAMPETTRSTGRPVRTGRSAALETTRTWLMWRATRLWKTQAKARTPCSRRLPGRSAATWRTWSLPARRRSTE